MNKIIIGAGLILALAATATAQDGEPIAGNVCSALRTERAKYPNDLTALCAPDGTGLAGQNCPLGPMLNAVAAQFPGFGLSGKRAGYRVPTPGGQTVAGDILMRAPNVMWDVFTASESNAGVECGGAKIQQDLNSRPFVAAVSAGGGSPTPTPTGGNTSGDVAAIVSEMNRLRDQITALKQSNGELFDRLRELDERHTSADDEQKSRLSDVESGVGRIDKYLSDKPIPKSCGASLFGIPGTGGCRLVF